MSLTAATIGANAIQAGASVGNQLISAAIQKDLLRNQYNEFFSAAHRAGATPAAIAQGLTNSGAASTPTASSGAPVPDLASNLISAKDVEEQNKNRETERQNLLLEMKWKPQRWFADIKKTWSEVLKNRAAAGLDRSLAGYYDEVRKSLVLKRPWELRTLRQGLINMQQELTNMKQKNLNMQKENWLMDKQGRWYDSQSDLNYSMSFNVGQEGYRLMYENDLRSAGWNPSEQPWPQVVRLAATAPEKCQKLLDTIIESLNVLDNKLKEGLGDHYKRNALILGGLYGVYNEAGRHQYNKSVRFDNFTRGIGNLIPLTGGSSPVTISGYRR